MAQHLPHANGKGTLAHSERNPAKHCGRCRHPLGHLLQKRVVLLRRLHFWQQRRGRSRLSQCARRHDSRSCIPAAVCQCSPGNDRRGNPCTVGMSALHNSTLPWAPTKLSVTSVNAPKVCVSHCATPAGDSSAAGIAIGKAERSTVMKYSDVVLTHRQ